MIQALWSLMIAICYLVSYLLAQSSLLIMTAVSIYILFTQEFSSYSLDRILLFAVVNYLQFILLTSKLKESSLKRMMSDPNVKVITMADYLKEKENEKNNPKPPSA